MIPLQSDEGTNQGRLERENCCFCRKETERWTALPDRKPEQQVACCGQCAVRAHPSDVPGKEEWYWRERICGVYSVPPPEERHRWTSLVDAEVVSVPGRRSRGDEIFRSELRDSRLFELARIGMKEAYANNSRPSNAEVRDLAAKCKQLLDELYK